MTAPRKTHGFTKEEIRRRCHSKVRYADEFAAMAGGMRSIEHHKTDDPLYAYKCPLCGGWHLTRSKQRSDKHIIRRGENETIHTHQ
jgi:hypothetical protein